MVNICGTFTYSGSDQETSQEATISDCIPDVTILPLLQAEHTWVFIVRQSPDQLEFREDE